MHTNRVGFTNAYTKGCQVRTIGKNRCGFVSETGSVHNQRALFGSRHDGDGLSLDQIAKKLVGEGVYSVLLEGGRPFIEPFLRKGGSIV